MNYEHCYIRKSKAFYEYHISAVVSTPKEISSLRESILFLHDPGEISDCVQAEDVVVCDTRRFDARGTIYGKILYSDNRRNLKENNIS